MNYKCSHINKINTQMFTKYIKVTQLEYVFALIILHSSYMSFIFQCLSILELQQKIVYKVNIINLV